MTEKSCIYLRSRKTLGFDFTDFNDLTHVLCFYYICFVSLLCIYYLSLFLKSFVRQLIRPGCILLLLGEGEHANYTEESPSRVKAKINTLQQYEAVFPQLPDSLERFSMTHNKICFHGGSSFLKQVAQKKQLAVRFVALEIFTWSL